LHSRSLRQHLNGGPALRIQSGVIGDQPNMLAAQGREFLCFEHIQAGLHQWSMGLLMRVLDGR